MSSAAPRRRVALVLAAAAMIVAGCSGSGEAVVTVVETTVIAPVIPSSTRPSPTTPATTSTAAPTSTTASTEKKPSPPASSTSRSGKRTGPATLVQATADPDIDGPDDGPACKAAPQYSDEAPTGLRQDVVEGWKAVRAKAKAQGIPLCLNDGKRSRAQQLAIYDEYVRDYGTQTADELVLTPDKSAHVAGYAVDVQPAQGYQWLQQSDGKYGFCRTYDNEAWHFEYAKAYITDGCPPRLPKPER